MNMMALDIEFNQPSKAIIQIGVAVFNVESGAILATGRYYINPNETLNPFIIDLCGISQEQVNSGMTVDEAYILIKLMYEDYNCDLNLVTWGGGDSDAFKAAVAPELGWRYGRRWQDAKTLYQAYMLSKGAKVQAGLAKALTRLGGAFKGRKHDAMDDAINTAVIYCKLIKLFK
jgi:inhibitor of KinA sporulation pathway (predicted exonuclease)